MNRYRTVLNLFLGLVLLVQGLAVAAEPPAALSVDATVPVSTMAHAMNDTVAGIPCHGSMMHRAAEAGTHQPSCCDESCPDMSACVLGHLAPIVTVCLALPSPAIAERTAAAFHALVSRAPNALLRPPIALHA